MTTPNFKGLKLFAHRIDEQLCDIIHKQLVKAIEEIESGLAETYKPESQAIVMFIFYTFSLYLDRPTPGRFQDVILLSLAPSYTEYDFFAARIASNAQAVCDKAVSLSR
jgi:hypothetical protein